MKLTIKNLDAIAGAAKEFLSHTGQSRIFAFYGGMGAGKTTFIKALCEQLGSVDVVTSPTFTLVNEYLTRDKDYLYHFDFYRINRPEEAYDFGIEEYLESGRYCFMEWPEKIEGLLPETAIPVIISVDDKQIRTLEIQI